MLEGVVPWPVEAAELYRKLGYWRGETIGECFDRSIADNAARLAVVDGEANVLKREELVSEPVPRQYRGRELSQRPAVPDQEALRDIPELNLRPVKCCPQNPPPCA